MNSIIKMVAKIGEKKYNRQVQTQKTSEIANNTNFKSIVKSAIVEFTITLQRLF